MSFGDITLTSDNNVSSYSISDGGLNVGDSGITIGGNNFIKVGKSKTIYKDSTVYIPDGANVSFSSTHDTGYKSNPILNITMDRDRTQTISSRETNPKHTHTGASGTVNVTIRKYNSKDTVSYQVYHTYNGSNCVIKTGDIDGTSASITTETSGNTQILFISNIAASLETGSHTYKMTINSSNNVTAAAYNSGDTSSVVNTLGPVLGLTNIKSNWSVNVTIS